MGGGGEDGGATALEFTPTWVVAGVCTVIVSISLAVERLLHFTGKYLQRKKRRLLFEALQKVKEGNIIKICVNQSVTHHLLPCKLSSQSSSHQGDSSSNTTETTSHHRRLLAEQLPGANYCAAKNKVPLLSVEALHHLHIFIFVLAIFHVTFRVLTVVFGVAKIRLWKHWEDSIAKDNYDTEQVLVPKLTDVHQHDFIKGRFQGIGKNSVMLGWLRSFFKQFYGSITRLDYMTLRHGFIMKHCRGNPKFDFHKFMICALEDDDDFKKAIGIRVLLIAVGTKLEHVVSQLVHEVAEKHVAIEGELVQYGFDSCIMGQVRYIVPRLVIGVFIQVLCSYSTLPLYAIATQRGCLLLWSGLLQVFPTNGSVGGKSTDGSTLGIQLGRLAGEESAPENISPTAAAAQGDTNKLFRFLEMIL
ncbi:unnamed protein product [Camellia sinensis]